MEIKIHSTFKHAEKIYILFSIASSSSTFLYFYDKRNENRSLFFGDDFLSPISSILENPTVECIECELGSRILGGLSLDAGDIVEFNFSLEQGNKILEELKKKMDKRNSSIKLF